MVTSVDVVIALMRNAEYLSLLRTQEMTRIYLQQKTEVNLKKKCAGIKSVFAKRFSVALPTQIGT